MKENTLTRQELYDLVWKESLTTISRRLNIPYSQLRKICSEMNVPLPLNGHWSKLKFGKPVEVIKLPQDFTGQNEIKLSPEVSTPATPSYANKFLSINCGRRFLIWEALVSLMLLMT